MHHQTHALIVVWDGPRTHEDEAPFPYRLQNKKKKEDHIIKVTEYYPGELALIFAFANFHSV